MSNQFLSKLAAARRWEPPSPVEIVEGMLANIEQARFAGKAARDLVERCEIGDPRLKGARTDATVADLELAHWQEQLKFWRSKLPAREVGEDDDDTPAVQAGGWRRA